MLCIIRARLPLKTAKYGSKSIKTQRNNSSFSRGWVQGKPRHSAVPGQISVSRSLGLHKRPATCLAETGLSGRPAGIWVALAFPEPPAPHQGAGTPRPAAPPAGHSRGQQPPANTAHKMAPPGPAAMLGAEGEAPPAAGLPSPVKGKDVPRGGGGLAMPTTETSPWPVFFLSLFPHSGKSFCHNSC